MVECAILFANFKPKISKKHFSGLARNAIGDGRAPKNEANERQFAQHVRSQFGAHTHRRYG